MQQSAEMEYLSLICSENVHILCDSRQDSFFPVSKCTLVAPKVEFLFLFDKCECVEKKTEPSEENVTPLASYVNVRLC